MVQYSQQYAVWQLTITYYGNALQGGLEGVPPQAVAAAEEAAQGQVLVGDAMEVDDAAAPVDAPSAAAEAERQLQHPTATAAAAANPAQQPPLPAAGRPRKRPALKITRRNLTNMTKTELVAELKTTRGALKAEARSSARLRLALGTSRLHSQTLLQGHAQASSKLLTKLARLEKATGRDVKVSKGTNHVIECVQHLTSRAASPALSPSGMH